MAITHADLSPSRPSTDLSSKTAACLIILTILCGLFCFLLCLFAEASRSEVRWVSSGEKGEEKYECVYSGSGKTASLCAGCAFLILAIGMVVEHTYMLIAVSKSPPPALVTWEPHSAAAKSLTWQACFFFVTNWICFAVGEILLLIGLSVESGHLKNWSRPRPNCLIIGEGLFSAAGVFGLAAVFLAAGLYLTALRAQRICQAEENAQREVLAASVLYASPPISPRRRIAAVARENPIVGESRNEQQPAFLYQYAFSKHTSLV